MADERKPDEARADTRIKAFEAWFNAKLSPLSTFEKAILKTFIYWEQTVEAKETGSPPASID